MVGYLFDDYRISQPAFLGDLVYVWLRFRKLTSLFKGILDVGAGEYTCQPPRPS